MQLPANLFLDLLNSTAHEVDPNEDELSTYLAAPCENISDENVLVWWRGQTQYPRLSRMAISYLTCPSEFLSFSHLVKLADLLSSATSVDVERIFSHGRILLPHTRNRMTSTTARALMCVGEWSRLGWVQDSDVVAALSVDSDSDD